MLPILRLLLVALLVLSSKAATYNVTNYAAIGDYTEVVVSVTTNSNTVVFPSALSGSDVGKIVQLFGAGYYSTLSSTGAFGGNYQGTPTNHQDLVATIVAVTSGTNITIDRLAGVTASDIRAGYGTQNKTAFDNAIAAAGSNDVIYIPAGNYLLMPPSALDSNYVQTSQFSAQPTITLTKGALTFLGDGTNSTILTGNGAWQQKGYDSAYRGYMFYLRNGSSAPDNNGPLYFNGIQFNGNATRIRGTYTFWPAIPTDGSGWDVTHHAITDAYTPTGNTYKSITNCLFYRWKGETIQGIADGTGFIDVGNCWFLDGNSTAINFNQEHDFHDNLVDDYYQVAEDGQFYVTTNMSYIRNNTFRNIYGNSMVAITGASTNVSHGGYTVSSNVLEITTPKYGIATSGVKSLNIISNYFTGGGIAIGTAGQQGNEHNHDWLIANNFFTNATYSFLVLGRTSNRQEDIMVSNNVSYATSVLAEAGEGAGSWSTNFVFKNNTASKGPWSVHAAGQYFFDDPSNDFPYYSVTDSAATNLVGYGRGYRQALAPNDTSAFFYLDDSAPAKIPRNARILLTNKVHATTLYLSASLTSPLSLSAGYTGTFYWHSGRWNTNGPVKLKARIATP